LLDKCPAGQYNKSRYDNCTIANGSDMQLAYANPIRYRGYYYDTDIGLYYLNARYYSPELRRFISPDAPSYLDAESVNGLNLYAYCNNDPVNKVDPTGHFAITIAISATLAKGMLIVLGAVIAASLVARLESDPHFISETVDVVRGKIDDLSNIKEQLKSAVIAYALSLVAKNHYDGGTENHHIVARKDLRAIIARGILVNLCKIDINDARNIAVMKKDYHRVIHTNLYYSLLTASMLLGYMMGETEGVLLVLDFYKKIGGIRITWQSMMMKCYLN